MTVVSEPAPQAALGAEGTCCPGPDNPCLFDSSRAAELPSGASRVAAGSAGDHCLMEATLGAVMWAPSWLRPAAPAEGCVVWS
jgi:hypothetical protein